MVILDKWWKNTKPYFGSIPGKTTLDCHYIPTKDPPICVPPWHIPGHYCQEVSRQMELMLAQGIIKESSSPWMAPAVFVPKKSGELRICIDSGPSISRQQKIPTLCLFLMRSRIISLMLLYSPPWTSIAVIGSFQWQKLISLRVLLSWTWKWVFSSFAACCSGFQVHYCLSRD